MSKHTPGEWDVNQFIDLDGDFHVQVVLKSNGCPLAHMYECGSETKANARLIAAAPDLLEALKALTHSLERGELLHDDQRAAFDSSIAAIAKAEAA
jgi:hypothetical protein